MTSYPSSASEWRRRAKRIPRRDIIDAILVAIVFGVIAICGGR